jgi:hypothetical protein
LADLDDLVGAFGLFACKQIDTLQRLMPEEDGERIPLTFLAGAQG